MNIDLKTLINNRFSFGKDLKSEVENKNVANFENKNAAMDLNAENEKMKMKLLKRREEDKKDPYKYNPSSEQNQKNQEKSKNQKKSEDSEVSASQKVTKILF